MTASTTASPRILVQSAAQQKITCPNLKGLGTNWDLMISQCGSTQQWVLNTLLDRGAWQTNSHVWMYQGPKTTERILESLVKRGLVVKTEGTYKLWEGGDPRPYYRYTPAAGLAVRYREALAYEEAERSERIERQQREARQAQNWANAQQIAKDALAEKYAEEFTSLAAKALADIEAGA